MIASRQIECIRQEYRAAVAALRDRYHPFEGNTENDRTYYREKQQVHSEAFRRIDSLMRYLAALKGKTE